MGGQIAPKNRLFSHWSSFGRPWVHFLDFWPSWASFWHLFGCPGHHFGTLGAHQTDAPAVQNSMQMTPQTDLAGFIFLEFFEIPGYHFGTLDPRQKCNLFLRPLHHAMDTGTDYQKNEPGQDGLSFHFN